MIDKTQEEIIMTTLNNKIDFVALISVNACNPNGDPLTSNQPRTNYDGIGEISDVCLKRKIRNRMQDLGNAIFVQSADRCDDGAGSLSERAEPIIKEFKNSKNGNELIASAACKKWLDVRSFGQVFAFKDAKGVSVGIRGPVSIQTAFSLSPVEIESMQITKSVNGEKTDKNGKASDTMGMKHFVKYGLYEVKGTINCQLAEKTGFSEEDAEVVKECLKTLFVNDASAARPEGSIEVAKLYWFKHNCKDGQYSSAKVHRSVKVSLKEGVDLPTSINDYNICVEELPGLTPEEYEGI